MPSAELKLLKKKKDKYMRKYTASLVGNENKDEQQKLSVICHKLIDICSLLNEVEEFELKT